LKRLPRVVGLLFVITDDQGNVVDTYSGSAATFQASGEWQLIVPQLGFTAGLPKRLSQQ
jgi:hypothetical protein